MHVSEVGTPLPLTMDFVQNPYPVYELLRQETPVREVRLPRGLKVWLVTGYEEARAALADPTLSKNAADAQHLFDRHVPDRGQRAVFSEALTAHMLNSDPPDHTRLRNLVTKAFTARTVQRMKPRVEEITTELLDQMAAGDDVVDLLAAFAFPLPVTVICELLGVPLADRHDFHAWTSALLSASGGQAARDAGLSMAGYLNTLVADKRANPRDDLLSGLIEATDEGDRLTETELVSMAFLLLVAGHETTVNLIGNGVFALLRNPDQLAALRADPDLMPGAIEEFLRFLSPVNMATFRFTTQPLRLGDVVIPEGEIISVALGSADRDEKRFEEPDRLDITRKAAGHLAFGHGIHYCLGAPLARLEGQIAIGGLIERFPDLALATEPERLTWRDSTLIRGLETLPVWVRSQN
jgi:cytochrome P450